MTAVRTRTVAHPVVVEGRGKARVDLFRAMTMRCMYRAPLASLNRWNPSPALRHQGRPKEKLRDLEQGLLRVEPLAPLISADGSNRVGPASM